MQLASATTACSSSPDDAGALSPDRLRDPDACATCHPAQYDEWSGSMHAYASKDPVFLAMNARGQRETSGQLGSFCVQCHAPVALQQGATVDGTNLAQVEAPLQGITCYFCHSVKSVDGTHNAAVTLAGDGLLRGPFDRPIARKAHHAGYATHFDRNRPESSALCGGCHDVVTPSPPAEVSVPLERSLVEWNESLFSRPTAQGGLACIGCHMIGRDGVAADVTGAPIRRVYSHSFPAVDVAVTPFPNTDAQLAEVRRELDATLRPEICVQTLPGGAAVQLTLENISAGHRWPSGAAHDRRAWVELIAYAGGQKLYGSGDVTDDASVAQSTDPDLWLLRDRAYDKHDQPAHMFWEVARVERDTIPAPVTFDATNPEFFATHLLRRYPRPTTTPNLIASVPDRVTLRVRVRAIGLDVLDDLIQSGDLDASLRTTAPVHDVLPTRGDSDFTLEWTASAAAGKRGYARTFDGLPARCLTSAASTPP